MNNMFESILRDTIGYDISSYTKNDMDRLYEAVIYECKKVARKHVLDKFGIQEPFDGTTEIEKIISEHFGV